MVRFATSSLLSLFLTFFFDDYLFFFFFNDTATTEIYTLSLHDALPISPQFCYGGRVQPARPARQSEPFRFVGVADGGRSEEHTSELQSRPHLVCRLLLEKKKNSRQLGRFRNRIFCCALQL